MAAPTDGGSGTGAAAHPSVSGRPVRIAAVTSAAGTA